jgi:PAS domain S-box-containing protein
MASAQEVRARFLKTHLNPTVRFLWQTDEQGRVTSLTPPLGEIVGGTNADLVGQELSDIVERLQLDPSGKLLTAMDVPETWSGIAVAWPIAGAAAAVPVDLGGFPVFDADRSFRGFRGFGVIHLDRIREAEPITGHAVDIGASAAEATPHEQTSEAPSEVPQAPGEELQAVAEAPQVTAEAAAATREDAPALQDVETPPPTAPGANVVPLRPYAALAAAFGLRPQPVEPPTTPALPPVDAKSDGNPPNQTLSASEHQAFDEVARAVSEGVAFAPPIPAPAEDQSPPAAADRQAEPPPAGNGGMAVLERLPLPVLISRNEVPIYANRAFLDLSGYQSLAELEAAGGLARLFEARKADSPHSDIGTHSIRTDQGELVPIESKLQAISWEGQSASLFTLRRADAAHSAPAVSLQLELQHRETEVRELRAILDTATDGVAILDSAGRILSLNRSAEALFGYEQNEVAGEPFTMLIAAESRALIDEYLPRLTSGAQPQLINGGYDVAGLARQGGAIPIFLTLGRVDGDERQPKFCAVMRDMSAWKQSEQQAREAREEAERASAIKSDFLAKVSHEIRTPLNAIIGFAEVIMDERLGPIGTERYKDYLRDIHKSGTHVMSLVNDLLDLSKIEAGKMVLDIKPVDANAIVAECVALMQPQANRERVIMRLALAPRLVHVAADERSVRQIVLNLLSNAVKYNEPGGQVIVSTAMTDTGQVVIRIKDTGIGMSDAELALALEPFRQVATARPVSGTGLGLPLTKALIEANRANFSIRSRKNDGTLVEVSFPPARILAESA